MNGVYYVFNLILLRFYVFLISFALPSYCVRNYQVQRINESTYLVNSLPDYDFNSKLLENRKTDTAVPMRGREELLNKDITTLVAVDDTKKSKKLPYSVINKARENYFRNFYATSKQPIASNLHEKVNSSSDVDFNRSIVKANDINEDIVGSNLDIARNLAAVLINEVKNRIARKPVNVSRNERYEIRRRIKKKRQR